MKVHSSSVTIIARKNGRMGRMTLENSGEFRGHHTKFGPGG
jgi:hypothetical protein